MFRNYQEAREGWAADRAAHVTRGVILPDVTSYIPENIRANWEGACDAMPQLTTAPNSAIPAMLTTMIDPQVFNILFSPNKAAKILGEQKRGTWVDTTIMFPTAESTGEVASYDDFSENGNAGANLNWPQRQQYLFQTQLEYGERETEMAGAAKVNWVASLEKSAATVLNKFSNFTYFFGVQGLQNYGLLNDPNLTAPLTPAPKNYGGTKWMVNGVIKASANEIFTDIQSMVIALINQSNGTIEEEDAFVLALSPQLKVALTATNSFAVNVRALLKENFPNITIESAVQYGELSATNPQGIVGGNLVQLIAKNVEGQESAFCAFGEKLRAHALIKASSSFKQKLSSGTWGAVIRQPFAIAQMLGV